MFCPDCGNPRSGITCPHCRTLNYRSFCSHCNAPLNDLAQDALTESSGDLTFVAMQSLAFYLGTIGQTLEKHEQKQPAELDNYNNKLLAQYNELLTSNSPGRPKREASAPRTAAGAGFYQQKVQEMQLLMDSLKPEEGITAQMQRNYYSARKLSEENLRSARHATGWMCNYCRCVHRQPSECVYKELGGKWIFE